MYITVAVYDVCGSVAFVHSLRLKQFVVPMKAQSHLWLWHFGSYRVDEPKGHHVSRKSFCSRVLWFYGSASLGEITLRSDFSIVFTVRVSFHAWGTVTEQHIFMCNIFMKKSLWIKWRRKFRRQFPHSPVPDKTTIYRLVKKLMTQALCKIRSLKWINGYWQMRN